MGGMVHITQDILTGLEGNGTTKCKCCGKSIWYDTTKVYMRSNGTYSNKYEGTTYRSSKNIYGVNYPIRVCQKCLEEKYPDFADKNKSRIFNTFNKYVAYAFEIPDEIIRKKNQSSAITLENCIRKYGEEKGTEVFDEYKRKQAYSNTFEYKRDKFGWSKEQFDKYNASRAITMSNLIKRHGEDEGMRIWKQYIERQSYTSTSKYLSEMYDEYGKETIRLLKSCKLEGFIRRYGESEGCRRYDDFINTITKRDCNTDKYHQSEIGFNFFEKLIEKLSESGCHFKYYYGDCEFKKYSRITNSLYSLDFYIPELNVAVEFNGDYWHANPDIYEADWFHPVKKQYARDIWKHDKERIEVIEQEFGMTVFVVWEKSILTAENMDNTICELLNKIRYVSENQENHKNE